MLYAKFLGIPWAVFVLIGILSLAYRRFIVKPKYLGNKISKIKIIGISSDFNHCITELVQ